jgi:hypothetical protein
VFGNNFEDHIARLDLVLERMPAAGLKMKPEKCQLLKPEVMLKALPVQNTF